MLKNKIKNKSVTVVYHVDACMHICMYCVCIYSPFIIYWDCSLAVSFCSGSLNASYVGSYHFIGALGSS